MSKNHALGNLEGDHDFDIGIDEIDEKQPGYLALGQIINMMELTLAEAEETVAATDSQHEQYWALVAAYHIVTESGLLGFRFKRSATRDDV